MRCVLEQKISYPDVHESCVHMMLWSPRITCLGMFMFLWTLGVLHAFQNKKKIAKTYMNQTVALCFEFTYLVVAFYFWYLQVTYGTCWTYRTCKLDLAHLQDNFPNYEHNLPKLDLATSQRYSKWKSIFPITQYHLFLLFSFLVKQKTSKNNDKSMLFWMFLKIDCFWHGDKNMWKL